MIVNTHPRVYPNAVDYASVLAFEVRSGTSGPTVNLVFKNGTNPDFVEYNWFSLDDFKNRLSVSLNIQLLDISYMLSTHRT